MAIIQKNYFGRLISNASDLIYGTLSADVINGLGGDDLIYAKAGNDVVTGGTGKDRISGGAGTDRLQFGADHDADTILDFRDHGLDTIVLDSTIDSYVVFDEGANVRIVTFDDDTGTLTKEGSITLQGVTAAEWTAMGGRITGWDLQSTSMGTLIQFDGTLVA